MKMNTNTEKHTETRGNTPAKRARKKRSHRTHIPIMRCTKTQRGGTDKPASQRDMGGGAPHGAKRPHLRIIVYK